MPSTTMLKNAKNTAATAQATLERAASRIGSRSVASRSLAAMSSGTKDAVLGAWADALESRLRALVESRLRPTR